MSLGPMWTRPIQFEIQEPLGEGSQGCVFKALRRDRASGMVQTVAAKILHSETAVELWRREFESLARVRSPYCLQVFAFERLRGRPALILEYVEGISLAQLAQACVLTTEEAAEIIAQAELGILDLHKFNVFHGDLSPHNVLVDCEGRIRLLDFGLANCVGESIRLTPEFAAPERLSGSPADLSSDIFSLGQLERFLLGPSNDSWQNSSYLRSEPASRSLRQFSLVPEVQTALAQKVKGLVARRNLALRVSTRTQAQKPAIPDLVKQRFVAAITAAMLLGAPATSPSEGLNAISPLNIRTQKWHYLKLDGSPIGYAPLSVPLVAGRTYKLEWHSARGKGQMQVHLTAGSTLTLSDSDFSH